MHTSIRQPAKDKKQVGEKNAVGAVFSGMNPLRETFLNVLNDCIECKDSKELRGFNRPLSKLLLLQFHAQAIVRLGKLPSG